MDLEITATNLLILLLLSSLHLLRRHLRRPSGGFKHYPLIGTLPDLLANRHRFLDWITAALSSTPTNTSTLRRPGRAPAVVTASPANVEHILKTNFHNYPKGDRQILFVRDFLGDGIFNANDELWRHQRKTASYEFNRRSLRNFVMDCVRVEAQTRLLPLLRDSSKSGRVLDLQDVLERFAFDNVCKVAFNVDPCCLSSDGSGPTEFMGAFEDATSLSSGRFLTALPIIWRLKRFFDVGSENRLRRSIRVVHQFADDIIEKRLQEKHDDNNNNNFDSQQDLLSRFIAADENSLEFLRDIVISFILAGRDTTSSALTWFFWLLSCHPGVTEKIRSELEWVRARGKTRAGECFEHDELREMNYLHAVLSESMRLYPPVPIGLVSCRNDDVWPDGTVVKKGWSVLYCSYAMGRMDKIWGKDCKEFKPERWMVEENGSGFGLCKTENPFKYPIFHAGPRVCLGREMAFIQMKSIAALVVEGFDMVVERAEKPGYVLSLTLRMKGGLPATFKPRKGVLDRT